MMEIDIIWLIKAIKMVANDDADKLKKGNVTVYAVKDGVGIYIKPEKE